MASPPNTLLFNGYDLRDPADFPGMRIKGDMNLFAPGTRKGEDQDIPGRHGLVPAPNLQLAAYSFTVTVIFTGTSRGDAMNNLYLASIKLRGPASDGLGVMTRRLANPGDTGYDEFTAQGRFVSGLGMALWNPTTGQTELQFVNLDGGWRRTSDNGFQIP